MVAFHLIWLILITLLASSAKSEQGIASVYANGDGHEWTKTSNGEVVNPNALTAAHKTLPLGIIVTVVNAHNGRKVRVRVNDRGPFVAGRIIDLTPAGSRAIACDGLCPVKVKR